MKFEGIEIDAFGTLTGLELGDLKQGLNVVYGPNGSGKTTLLQFLRGVFCGFGQARRLKLLPAHANHPDGCPPAGGAVSVLWDGDQCRFQRAGDIAAENQLRVTVVKNGRLTSHPTFSTDSLPSAQIPLLFTVERADVHAFDGLIRMALRDGIELITSSTNADSRAASASDIDQEQAKLANAERLRIAKLQVRRQRLQAELQQLRLRHDERCRELQAESRKHLKTREDSALERVNWLDVELQAAESDLREAEEAIGRGRRLVVGRQPLHRFRPRLVRRPTLEHLTVNHREELKAVDGRIEEVRNRLAEIARARLQNSLRAARIAGSPEMPTTEIINRLRVSLGVMEDTLLALRESAQMLEHWAAVPETAGEVTPVLTQSAVEELSRRLYGVCQHVTQFEVQQVKATLDAEAAQLNKEEEAQHLEMQSLQEQRQQLRRQMGYQALPVSPHSIGQEFCQCSEHPSRDDEAPSVDANRLDAQTAAQPHCSETLSLEELSQLRDRRDQLRLELEQARHHWRQQRPSADDLESSQEISQLTREADQLQCGLQLLDQELARAKQQHRRAVETNAARLASAAEAARAQQPRCLQRAAAYLARLTAGRYVNLHVLPEHYELRIVDDQGVERGPWSLSRGTLDQVALSLRLALVREYAERDVRFPIVLDDVLVDCDVGRLQEAVRLLKEFAEEGQQQILFFTCGTHLVNLFTLVGATLHTMPGSIIEPPAHGIPREAPANWSVQGWIDRRFRARGGNKSAPDTDRTTATERHDVQRESETTISRPETDPTRTSSPDKAPMATRSSDVPDRAEGIAQIRRRQPGEPYWLSLESPLILLPSVGEQMGRRLAALGIRSVGDLLDLTAEESSIPLKSLQVDVVRLQEWQAEANLLSCVPDLAGPDAQLLVACGVTGPHQLAESDVEALTQRLDRHSRRNREAHARTQQPTRSDLQRWIQNARHSRSIEDARSESNRRGRATHKAENSAKGAPQHFSTERTVNPFPRSTPSAAGDAPVKRNFYLSLEAPVVDAPSIGPRMASRLEKQGIISVADLLARKAAEVANRLRHRRVTADTVTTWQQQARLMCRIPELRGHDAQVLVACDITEPEQVASLDARTLFSIIGPFVATKEGQRLLRSSKTPDLAEVADWIEWANHARPLKAA